MPAANPGSLVLVGPGKPDSKNQLVVALAVVLDQPREQIVAGALVEADGPSVGLLRRGLDQQEASTAPERLILGEAQQPPAVAPPVVFRVDGDPVEVERAVGERRGAEAGVA